MIRDRPGKCPARMPEQLAFQQGRGVLAEVGGNKQVRKAILKGIGRRIKWNPAAFADGRRGRPFARAGRAFNQGGKILHFVPEILFIPADILREDIIP